MSLSGLALLAVVTSSILLLIVLLNVVLVRVLRRVGRLKQDRFEAGNPPIDVVRKKLIMQYFGFIFLIVVLELAFLLVLLLALGGGVELAQLLITIVIIYTLTTLIICRYAGEVREWT